MVEPSSGIFRWSYLHNVNTKIFQKTRLFLRREVKNTRGILSLSQDSYISGSRRDMDDGYILKEIFRLK